MKKMKKRDVCSVVWCGKFKSASSNVQQLMKFLHCLIKLARMKWRGCPTCTGTRESCQKRRKWCILFGLLHRRRIITNEFYSICVWEEEDEEKWQTNSRSGAACEWQLRHFVRNTINEPGLCRKAHSSATQTPETNRMYIQTHLDRYTAFAERVSWSGVTVNPTISVNYSMHVWTFRVSSVNFGFVRNIHNVYSLLISAPRVETNSFSLKAIRTGNDV